MVTNKTFEGGLYYIKDIGLLDPINNIYRYDYIYYKMYKNIGDFGLLSCYINNPLNILECDIWIDNNFNTSVYFNIKCPASTNNNNNNNNNTDKPSNNGNKMVKWYIL